MGEEVKYGVLHEVGEYQDFKEVSEEDNEFLNEQDRKNKNSQK